MEITPRACLRSTADINGVFSIKAQRWPLSCSEKIERHNRKIASGPRIFPQATLRMDARSLARTTVHPFEWKIPSEIYFNLTLFVLTTYIISSHTHSS